MQYILEHSENLFQFMKNIKASNLNLFSYLSAVPSNRLFVANEQYQLSYSEVLVQVEVARKILASLAGKNVALVAKDNASMCVYLIAIQSIAASVYLQSSDINENTEQLFYKNADISYRVEVEGLEINSIIELSLDCDQESSRINTELGRIVLATSGTTGVPKLASYSLKSLMSTCKPDIDRGDEFVWGLCYDINRFAGLQVFLQAIASGSKLIVSDSDMIDERINTFIKYSVNCLSATPSFWRKLLMAPNHELLSLKRITLGGEISSQQILSALHSRYPIAKIVHIYASTEAGVGFAVKDALEGFPEDYLRLDFDKNFQLKEKDNILWIKTPNVKLNLIRGSIETDEQGFINTGDRVEVRGGRVYFLGRDSGSINVGGNKVMPEKVELVIEQCHMVSMAKVYAKKSPILGSLVVADVVLHSAFKDVSLKELKEEVLSVCRQQLASFEVPVMIKSVEQLKMNATGKLLRN